jgi:Major capsid protein N-terminus/Large eukaryotic DNA virus major capsid protein
MAQTAAVIALNATSAADEYILNEKSEFRPVIRQHTHFSKFHRVTKLPGTTFVGQTVEVILDPKQLGDLMTNVYLALTIPALPTGYSYTEFIGRAIIEHIEFRIGEQIVEKITDDWYIIRDQLFLDADEKLALYKAVNNGQVPGSTVTATTAFEVMIPLELFFCRRHSHGLRSRQRIEKPPLPLCAVTNQKISFKFFFRPQTWFTNYTTTIEFVNPRLITEEIMLTPEERLYYRSTPFRAIINVTKNDAVTKYQNGQPTQYFTADFPVTMMAWFVRNKNYTFVGSNTYYASRYAFGYTTKYLLATTPITFFDGTTNKYIDVLQSSDIYLNGKNIMGTFATGPFYQFKQPMDHGLSVPSKSLYVYCFGKSPKEYNQGGYMNFKNINAQTSKIVMTFIPGYSPNLEADYNISLYYYGYAVLQIAGGKAVMV